MMVPGVRWGRGLSQQKVFDDFSLFTHYDARHENIENEKKSVSREPEH